MSPNPSTLWFLILTSTLCFTRYQNLIDAQYARDRFRGNPTRGYVPVKLHPCEQSSCYPATGNLLIGRESQLYASSTCGLYDQQRYCIVSHLEERKKCFWCDSRPKGTPKPQTNHNISNIVYPMYPGTRQQTWWQSENGKEKVYIQLDLEAEFHFTHLIITFKTFRPAAMLIERSYDFKKSWQVYRHFAHNCAESYPGIPEQHPENLTDVVCESRYSSVAPSSGGEIIYRVLPPNLPIDDPYSEEVQNLLKITNLRINFTKLHTLGDDLLDKREEIQEKYYYAITHMVVRGSCSCYGHANRCLPLPGIDPKPDMVHGRCECTHNTKGRNCEKCEDFFNDLPWRPAIGQQTNACRRCNCNNHATSCHFDPAVYEATGRVSGGVCDGCQHHTMGPNCEQCKPFYYRDPTRDIQDPEVCRPCDCDPEGALDEGICDSSTDPQSEVVAGSCHCKTNVEGRRCDVCKNGYWNFTKNNPEGCQSCTCNTLGTVDNQGCNAYTGECTCKRYVIGRDCNQCLPEYWGLSERRDGCQPCDCDVGGSFDNNCDVITGQCRCREHMTGRTCQTPTQQHFTASLDFLLYEAELARASPTCQVVIREPYRDGSEDTWTGPGFVKNFEGSFVEFTIDNIKTTMEYDPVIRYETTTPDNWENVTVTFIRHEPIGYNTPCAENYDPRDDVKTVSLPGNSRSVTVYPPVCLEAGKVYTVRIDFGRSQYGRDTPSASVLIDSFVLIPRIDKIPWFHGSSPAESRKQEFERYCSLAEFNRNGQVSEICKKYYNSIGAFIFNGAISCECDPTGSVSKLCDEYGGNCVCKLNVVGRRCNRCAPGTYGFGPEGCRACECNSIGALDNFCNATTGQCKCRANTYGRECNQCRTGFWNFPHCQRCDCNGHADICDSRNGACINCRDNTQGHTCDVCTEGFYGDPRLNVDIPCRPCPCPGIPGSSHSYADRCSLDPSTKDVLCECQEGYVGARCDVCAENYYGNPEIPGGRCQPCECNDKIDLTRPGNCDPHTGVCKQCLYDTTGDHCEVCQPGFFRLAEELQCQKCNCHLLGTTNSSSGTCDQNTGQCPCLPNVTGLLCDQCEENYWKLASGFGCEPCNCDPLGSIREQCHLYEGVCSCRPGFGGRQCNECLANFWGDPKVKCNECNCNLAGSIEKQCNKETGACICLPGIGGYNCDKCDRGYYGNAPSCIHCGECFENWDRVIQELKNETQDVIDKAGDIKKVGATGAYTKEFEEMQVQLEEVESLLNNTADIDLDSINNQLDKLRKQINETEHGGLKELDDLLGNTRNDIYLNETALKALNKRIENLQEQTNELDKNGTQLQESNVQGALNLIQHAKEKATVAAHKAERTQDTVDYAERQCRATENLIRMTEKGFMDQLDVDKQSLQGIEANISALYQNLPELNNMICDGQGNPCDSQCGGAGCGSCGGSIACENGAKQLAEAALSIANETEHHLHEKEATANDFIRNVSQINTNATKAICQEIYDEAEKAFQNSNETLTAINNLQNRILEFLYQNNSKPEDVRKVAEEILKKNIQLQPEEIKGLAEQIREKVRSLKNIKSIINETSADSQRVQSLKETADNAKKEASDLLAKAGEVNDALDKTDEAQKDAHETITNVLNDIDAVNKLINKLSDKTKNVQLQINDTAEHIKFLNKNLGQLQNNITNNYNNAKRLQLTADKIKDEAQRTYDNSTRLQSDYHSVQSKLQDKLTTIKDTKKRAEDLITRALALMSKVTKTEKEINDIYSSSQEVKLEYLENTIQRLIGRMANYIERIDNQAQMYKVCTL